MNISVSSSGFSTPTPLVPGLYVLPAFHLLFHLVLTRTLLSGYCYPHFTDEETVPREVKTSPKVIQQVTQQVF